MSKRPKKPKKVVDLDVDQLVLNHALQLIGPSVMNLLERLQALEAMHNPKTLQAMRVKMAKVADKEVDRLINADSATATDGHDD